MDSNEPLVIVDRIEAADDCLLLELSPMLLKAARLSSADLDPRGNFKVRLRGEPIHVGDLRNPYTMVGCNLHLPWVCLSKADFVTKASRIDFSSDCVIIACRRRTRKTSTTEARTGNHPQIRGGP